MTSDEAALNEVEAGRAQVVVRCYGWQRPAVTIGRLQDQEAVRSEFGERMIYRRPTGGRAILHGDDLTIAIAANQGSGRHFADNDETTLIKRGVLSDYFTITEPIRDALAKFGIATVYGQDAVQYRKAQSAVSTDCMKTSARCDIVDAKHGIKICGSAMRRASRAFLVQMTLNRVGAVDLFNASFLRELQHQLARYLSVEQWDFPAR